jgi:hypothetical protein
MVWHPDQSGLPEGARRFVVSLRATDERYISSITFWSGVIDAAGRIDIDEPTRYGQRILDPRGTGSPEVPRASRSATPSLAIPCWTSDWAPGRARSISSHSLCSQTEFGPVTTPLLIVW